MIELRDGDLTALIDLRFGNNLFSLKLRDREFLWAPPDFRSKPALGGIPLLAPWANRIDGDRYFANGKSYHLNPHLGNLRRDGNGLAIHGLLAFTDRWRIWKQTASWVTCRLQFWLEPQYMAHFPFAHTIEITYALRDGALEVETEIRNLSSEPMPLCIGFHPYFQLPDSSRNEWTLNIPARRAVNAERKAHADRRNHAVRSGSRTSAPQQFVRFCFLRSNRRGVFRGVKFRPARGTLRPEIHCRDRLRPAR